MTEHTFANFLQRAIKQSGKSLAQIVTDLKRVGSKINRSTLSRWQNGRSSPSWDNLDILQHLPAILNMSVADRATYHHLLSQIIGGYQSPYSQETIPHRMRFLGGELVYFAGREKELAMVETAVSKRQSLLITGLGGIGKTSLARKALQEHSYRFIHGCDALQLASSHQNTDILHHVCQHLNSPISPEIIRKNPQAALDELKLWASRIDLLFLLDNVSQAEQIQELLSSLPNITWIITSRQQLYFPHSLGLKTVQLDVPNAETSIKMMLHYANAPNSENNIGSASKVAAKLGNYPIALHTAGALITSGQLTDLSKLEQWLVTNHITSLKIAQWDILHFFEQLLTNIQPKGVHDLLTLCGAFPEPQIDKKAFRQIAVSLKLPIHELPKLVEAALIQPQSEKNSYTLHPLIHEYAQYRLNHSSKQTTIRYAFSQYYAHIADENRDKPIQLDPHINNILLAAEYAYQTKNWDHLCLLWGPITRYLWLHSKWEAYLKFDQQCLEIAKLEQDLPHQARILDEIAWVNYEQGNLDTAISLCDEARTLHKRLNNVEGQIRSLRYLGIFFIEKQELPIANQYLTEAHRILNDIKHNSETEELWPILQQALIYHAWAEIAQLEGDLETAVIHTKRGFQLSQKTANIRITGIIQLRLGDLYFHQGNLTEANRAWREIATNPQTANRQEKRILAGAQFRIAQLAAHQNQRDQALYWANLSKNIYNECGQIDKRQKLNDFSDHIQHETTPFSLRDIKLWD